MSIQKVLKLSLCGGSAVGKSSIGRRLANQEPDPDHVATIGVDYFARRLPAYNAKIGIWDLAGDTRFEPVTLPYIKGSTIILYVYDLTRYETIKDMRRLYKIYGNICNVDQIKTIVVGNKRDIEDSYNSCAVAGEKFARKLGVPHIVVSAKKNQGIDGLLSVIVTEMELEEVKIEIKIEEKDVRMCDNCMLS